MATPSAAAPLVSIGDYANIYFNGSATARYDDNIFLEPGNEESDVYFVLAPGLELNLGTGGNSNVNLYYREDFYRYVDNDNLDTNKSNVFLETYYNMPRLELRFDGSYQQLIQAAPDLRSPSVRGQLIERDRYNGNLRGEYEISERTSIASGASAARVEFDTRGFTDTDSFAVPFNFYYAMTPKLDLSAGYRYRYTDTKGRERQVVDPFMGTISRQRVETPDYRDHYFNLGLRGEIFPKLIGEARTGYQQRRIEDLDNVDLLSFGVDFSHYLTPKTTLLAGLYRDFETGGRGSAITATGGSLGARYALSHLFSGNAGVNFFERRYASGTSPDGSRTDETLDLNVGLTYAPTVQTSLSAGYIFRTNDSNVDFYEFDNNIFTLSASLRY